MKPRMEAVIVFGAFSLLASAGVASAGPYCDFIERQLAPVHIKVILCDETSDATRVGAVIQLNPSASYTYLEYDKQRPAFNPERAALLQLCVPFQSDLETRLCRATGMLRETCKFAQGKSVEELVASDCSDVWATEVTDLDPTGPDKETRKNSCRRYVAFCVAEMRSNP
jgi:hypothetical protein